MNIIPTFPGIRILLLLPFLVSFQSDAPLNQYIIPIAAYSISSADLDMDGDVDIVTGHNYNSQTHWGGISIILNSGYGYFNLEDTLYFFGWQAVLCEQLDNDSLPEIIMKKETTNTEYIGILYNNNCADSLFLNTNKYDGIEGITSGDIDGNGFKDIAFYCNAKRYWGVFYNYGYRNFSPPEFHNVIGTYPSNIACGDLNGDGRDDVVLSGQITEVFYSLPSGFQQVVLESNDYKDMLAIVDFDGDGDNDLLTATFANRLVMYRNINDSALQALPWVSTQISSMNLATVDFNNDNLPDIAFLTMYPDTSGTGITYTIGGINIFYNLGNFQLSTPQFVSLTNYDESWRNFHVADFDGNGYKDFAVIRALTNQTSTLELLFNDGNGNFVGTPVGINGQTNKNQDAGLTCFPNPFHGSATFTFDIEQPALVELDVYDLRGNLIRCLTKEKLKSGQYSISWQGFDNRMNACESGAYLGCIKVNGTVRQAVKLIRF
ncbi:MAG: FG-GAP-like repeat-containing protein [Bacteroidetes bacterium]|nr:FG-GAP-like repeat-containing protein [Bacteroidota bacterium]